MEKKLAFELRRKSIHFLYGILLVFLLWFLPTPEARLTLLGLLVFGIASSWYVKHKQVPLITRALELFERKEDRKIFPGKAMIMMTAGALLPIFFVNHLLAITGLIVLIIADACAHLIGLRWGNIRIPWNTTKQLEGRIIGVLASLLVIGIWWEFIFIHVNYVILLVGITAGMLVETLPLHKIGIDDNLLIPLATALTIYFLTPFMM